MSLHYSLVARGPVVLCEYSSTAGNFNSVALECLQNIKESDNKLSINCDKHTFNFLIQNGYAYLVVADESYGRQIPYAFLDRIKDEFQAKYSEKGRTAAAHSLDKSFGPRLKYHMEYCVQHPEELSKVLSVQQKVNEVKNIMVENIEKVIERGEKIELLVDKTDDLRSQAEVFQKRGRQLRNKMWWANCKMKLVVLLVLLLLGVVIFCLVCFSGGNCLK